jgi:hypothetical protein
VHPREPLRDFARLVGLQLSDEMPAQRFDVAQCVDLVDGFLDVVLAEVALSGRERRAHRFGRLLLAHGHEADALTVPSRAGSRLVDTIAH